MLLPLARLLVLALVLTLVPVPAVAQDEGEPPVPTGNHEMVLDIAFPTRSDARYSDGYDACRSGCARRHQATDLMGAKHSPLYATVDGRVCSINDEPEEDSYGRNITICGDDGHRYRYLHVNNDTPGTDDGAATMEHIYGPGMRRGQRVGRGQLIAFMGDSGNAEGTGAHLHLDIMVEGVVNPYGEDRINPYPSLQAARARGEYPDGSAVATDPTRRVGGEDRVDTAILLAQQAFDVADVAVLAPSTSPADALAAGPLAAVLEGPVLTTAPGGLDPRVGRELARLGVRDVVVVGGIIEDAVVASLDRQGLGVEVLSGSTRFATAALVAERIWELTGQRGEPTTPGIVGDPVPDVADNPAEQVLDAAEDVLDELEPTEVETPSPLLAVSASPDRAEPVLLAGAVATDTPLHVFLVGIPRALVRSVTFRVGAREPHTEREWPWDAAGSAGAAARPLQLDAGVHRIEAAVELVAGATLLVDATLEVVEGGRPRGALVALGAHDDPARSWPDALLAGYHGALTRTPVLLTTADETPAATTAALADVVDVAVVGGPAAIGDDQVEAFAAAGADVRRLAGATRYATGLAVVDDLIARDALDIGPLWLSTGRNWPDALVAGPVVAARGEVLLLVNGAGAPDTDVRDWLAARADGIDLVLGVGGEAALPRTALVDAALQVS